MKKIILASNSPQRRNLLKLLGLKFIVRPSKVKEITTLKASCARLVIKNALRKACDVAKTFKNGIVIGADTLVYLGHYQMIGKPRNLKHAKRILKMLSLRPSFVYTGLAVIDVEKNKTITGFEKTKIVMQRLSDRQIQNYYARVSPFDKAGGFDIQGKGGLLIKRIEGCYFNVVGLPIAKLCEMIKEIGVSILMLVMIFSVSGCATEYNLATGQEETLLYGTDKEVKLGDAMSEAFEKETKMVTDADINERVSNILKKIAAVCDRKDVHYSIKIVDNKEVNAISLPGGYVYVNKGLVDVVENDDQLASVIAHEVGHITARHSIKKIQSLYGYTLLKLLSVQTTRNADFAQGVDLAFASIFTAYSQEDEFLADKLGIKYAKAAGYNSNAMVAFLKKLGKIQEKEPSKEFSYWRTHPYISQRVAAANAEISGSMDFKGYLNLIGEQ